MGRLSNPELASQLMKLARRLGSDWPRETSALHVQSGSGHPPPIDRDASRGKPPRMGASSTCCENRPGGGSSHPSPAAHKQATTPDVALTNESAASRTRTRVKAPYFAAGPQTGCGLDSAGLTVVIDASG